MTSEPLNDADDTTASAASDAESFSTLLAAWNEAIVANDPEEIGRFAEPDWVFVGENGIFPGDQFLDSVAKGQVTHDFMTSDVHDVRVYGDVAIVTARVRNSGTFEGNPFQLDEWSTDVFIRRADGWRCAITHLTSVAAHSAAGTSPDKGR
ncbi:MAG: nuclear transport factor 2 family protein [Acidimicrobiales bacterium]